ncbi:M64 family metallopeptidase [uncultured Bacteroides sp.]|uniref:M64 family metallopeptidase n=1 Tax=uncultured Bacteroides sp. TaxID=162156 RepID=UPI00280AC1A3|nr:M64 family metallopeptidase [uncultured Bacteroides sp.]
MKQYLLSFVFIILAISCTEQEIEPNFSFQADTDEITLPATANSQTVIRFTSTREWQASTNSQWLGVTPASGEAGTCEVTLTAYSTNQEKTSRSAILQLVSDGLTQSLTVTQSAADYVEPEQTIYYVGAEETPLQIHFTTNISTDELSIYKTSSWLVQEEEESRSVQEYILNITAQANPNETPRIAHINFYKNTQNTYKDLPINSITIIQDGKGATTSTDYSADKTVQTLQQASEGKGLPIVLMGDGFLDTEIADGTYDKVMNKAMENLFTEEPLKSLRNYFNVYSVTAVSSSTKFDGLSTTFGCQMEGGSSTLVFGNDETVMEYAKCVEGLDLSETLAVVILNSSAYAGTTYFGYSTSDQMSELAISYCPIIEDLENDMFREVLVHEAVGHGFAKLEDEYSYDGKISSTEIQQVQTLQSYGWAQNVDFTQDESAVLWTSFLNDSRYEDEKIGIYEGACTYMYGAYRPTEDSMMNSNTCGFNAPSRKAIYDMVMERGENRTPDYEEFVTFDQSRSTQAQSRSRTSTQSHRAFARPHFVNKPLPTR